MLVPETTLFVTTTTTTNNNNTSFCSPPQGGPVGQVPEAGAHRDSSLEGPAPPIVSLALIFMFFSFSTIIALTVICCVFTSLVFLRQHTYSLEVHEQHAGYHYYHHHHFYYYYNYYDYYYYYNYYCYYYYDYQYMSNIVASLAGLTFFCGITGCICVRSI